MVKDLDQLKAWIVFKCALFFVDVKRVVQGILETIWNTSGDT